MARGKKTSPEDIYKIMASWAMTDSFAETSKLLGIPEKTVEKIVKENKGKEEFAELCVNKRIEFSAKASSIIDKGLQLLKRRFDRALEHESDLDILIDEIYSSGRDELSQDEKNKLVTKLRALQLQDIKAITNAIATLFDKRALAEGSSTDNVTVNIKLPEGIEEYAG